MRFRKPFVFVLTCMLLICFGLPLCAQTAYRAGYAKESIEPGQYPFSIPLAGYGFPREGRFSLEWIKKVAVPGAVSIAGDENHVYVLKDRSIKRAKAKDLATWKEIGPADRFLSIAVEKGSLYGLDHQGNLFRSFAKGRLNWEKIAKIENPTAFAVLDGRMYVAQQRGSMIYADLDDKTLNWLSIAGYPGVKSLTAYSNNLYLVTKDDDLMKLDLHQQEKAWVRIARYNGLSFDVRLKSIAVADGKLLGLDQNGTLFESRHMSSGNLSVSAMALSSGRQTTVIVGADLCGLEHRFVVSVKEEIRKQYGIEPSAIMINSSHTHFGPVAQHWPTWPEFMQAPDSIYINTILRPALIRSIAAALKKMVPADLYFGRSQTKIGHNRTLSGEDIPYDNDVDVLLVVAKKNKQKTVLFLTGCHPVFKNEGTEGVTLGANYPAVTRDLLRNGAGITNAFFIQGCGGDINPVEDSHQNTGAQLAADVQEVLNRPMEKLDGAISFLMDSIEFPVDRWEESHIRAFRKDNLNDHKDVYAEKNVRWADLMLNLHKKNSIPATMPVYIQTFNIGNWKLLGLSREAVTDYSIGIKKLWPGRLVSVAGYCNDVSSYLPTRRHIQAGVYEGVDSFFWYGQPSVFPMDVYERILSRIKANNY